MRITKPAKLGELGEFAKGGIPQRGINALQHIIDYPLKGQILLDVINNVFNGDIFILVNCLNSHSFPYKSKIMVDSYLMSTDERKAKIDQINKELEDLL